VCAAPALRDVAASCVIATSENREIVEKLKDAHPEPQKELITQPTTKGHSYEKGE
jgi:hypothetical protein